MTDDDRSDDDDPEIAELARQGMLKLDGGAEVAPEELWSLIDLSEEMFAITGFDGRFRVLNKAWETTLGLSRAELRESPFMEFVHPDDRDKTSTVMTRIVSGARLFSFQNRYRTKDGSYRPLTWQAFVSPDRQRIYSVARDGTPELAAQERDNLFDALCEQSRDAIVSQSPEGVVKIWTGSAAQIFGYSAAEIVGQPLSRYLSHAGSPVDLLRLISAFPALERAPAELRHKDGSRVPVLVAATAVGDGATQITGAIATISLA